AALTAPLVTLGEGAWPVTGGWSLLGTADAGVGHLSAGASLPCLQDEIQAIASMMEKQAKIVVKPKEVSQEEKQRKAALLAQYANVTDEEEYPFPDPDEQDGSIATAVNIGSEKSLFRNTNVEDVLNARKLERELLRDEFQKKKEQDKLQREKDKLAKQERKEKEKKRTQKGERKR
uniref:Coiled-coil domain containing 43 n=1 Tax=Athene cunicularia TaxID=194338 RepID=A0A663MVH7_ATHCN